MRKQTGSEFYLLIFIYLFLSQKSSHRLNAVFLGGGAFLSNVRELTGIDRRPRVSDAVNRWVFFGGGGGVKLVKRQLLQLQASADGALPRRCRLLTPLALVFYHLKVTENRGREESGCLTADEPQRQPHEPSPGKRRQSASKSISRSRSGGIYAEEKLDDNHFLVC